MTAPAIQHRPIRPALLLQARELAAKEGGSVLAALERLAGLDEAAFLVELGRAFRHAASEEDRTQIKWYLIGLLAGLRPFLVFYHLPLALTDRPLVSEDLASIFFFLLPIFMPTSYTFSGLWSFVRYWVRAPRK